MDGARSRRRGPHDAARAASAALALVVALLLAGCGVVAVTPPSPPPALGGSGTGSTPEAALDPTAPASTPDPSDPLPPDGPDPPSTELEASPPNAALFGDVLAGPAAAALATLNSARTEAGSRPLAPDAALTDLAAHQADHYASGATAWDGDFAAQLEAASVPAGLSRARYGAGEGGTVEHWLAEPTTREELLSKQWGLAGIAQSGDGAGSVTVIVLGTRADDGRLPLGSDGAQEVLDLTNAERARNGLPALARSDDLDRAAQVQADHQAAILEMTHEGNGGLGSRLASVGYATGAENVAAGYLTLAEVVQGWIDSPGHHENMLREEVSEMGFALAVGADGRAYVAQVFGHR